MAGKWVKQIFKAKIARKGGLVRRKKSSIQRHASIDEVRLECELKGHHIVENGDQWVIFCNKGNVRIIQ